MSQPSSHPSPAPVPMARLWLLATGWWTASAVLGAEQQMGALGGDLTAFLQALARGLLGYASWIPFTVLLIWLAYRHPIGRHRLASHLALYAAVLAAIIVLRALWVYAVNPLVGWYPAGTAFTAVLAASVRGNALLGWMLIGAAHALAFADFRRRDREQLEALQAELQEARFQALSARLNPHFLFNSLSSIAELVHRQPQAADDMLVGLSALLRRALAANSAALVPLAEELALCRHYLDIEALRLGERLRPVWHVDPAALAVPVPPLLLQPLVENAIVHAAAPREAATTLSIRARIEAEALVVVIEDRSDEALSPSLAAGSGLGLASVRERLRLAYGGRAALDSHGDAFGTRVQLTVLAPGRDHG